MTVSALRLRPLRLDDEQAVRSAQRVTATDSFTFAFDLDEDTDWPTYVADIERCGGVLDLDRPGTAGEVPTRRYWIA